MPRPANPHRERIIALRKAGVGPREIARRLNCSIGVVSGVLHRAGLCDQPSGRGFGYPDDVKRRAAREAATATYREVAERYGVSIKTVFEWFRDAPSGVA